MIRFLFILALFACAAFPIERLSKKEIKQFSSSYEMLKDGYLKGHYKEVEHFGKKTIEEFKIIPLDNRKKIINDLQPKYLEIFYLVAKSSLHLALKSHKDSLDFLRQQKNYDGVEEVVLKIREEIDKSGILEKSVDGEVEYFSALYMDAGKIMDSVSVWIQKDFNASPMGEKEKIVAKYKARLPHLTKILDSLNYDAINAKYYSLMNGKDAPAINDFIARYPDFDKVQNLKNHLKALVSDDYNYTVKAKDIKLYQEFIERYPDSPFKREIESRLEYQIMKESIRGQSLYYCQRYMENYPKGRYLQEVVTTFEKLTRGEKENSPRLPAYIGQ